MPIALRTGQQVRLGAGHGAAPTWPCAAASSSSQCSDRAPTDTLGTRPGAAGRRRSSGRRQACRPGWLPRRPPPRSAGAGTVVLTASPGRARALRRRGCAVRGDLDGQRGQQPRRHPPRRADGPPLEHLPDLPELRSEASRTVGPGAAQRSAGAVRARSPRHRRVSGGGRADSRIDRPGRAADPGNDSPSAAGGLTPW